MKSRKLFLFVFTTILVMASNGFSQESVATVDELIDIANSYIEAKNQLLVNGYSDVDLEYHPLSSSCRETIRSDSEEILKNRELLIADDLDYSDFQTKLTVKEKQISQTKAVVKADEYTILRLYKADTDPLAPKATEYVQEHLFTFILDQDGQWQLSSDELTNVPVSVIQESGEGTVQIEVESTVADKYSKPEVHTLYMPQHFEISEEEAQNADEFRDKNEFQYGNEFQAEDEFQDGNEFQLTASLLNRGAIVRYALRYWKNYNPSYRRFSNDCTNFVSQAVRAGNWRFVNGWYRSYKVWWYNRLNQSWTWAGAHNWFLFTWKRPRGHIAKYFSQMQPGDILQMDFSRDGHIDHSMIVTKKDSSKTIYLTYHTSNTKNRSIKSILAQYPKAAYYGWRLDGVVK